MGIPGFNMEEPETSRSVSLHTRVSALWIRPQSEIQETFRTDDMPSYAISRCILCCSHEIASQHNIPIRGCRQTPSPTHRPQEPHAVMPTSSIPSQTSNHSCKVPQAGAATSRTWWCKPTLLRLLSRCTYNNPTSWLVSRTTKLLPDRDGMRRKIVHTAWVNSVQHDGCWEEHGKTR